MGEALDKFFELVETNRVIEQHKNDIYEKTWHIEYFLFSFNKDMFGPVYHNWYPAGSWEAPNSEYDFDYEKGFKLYDKDYRCDVIDIEADDARYDNDEWRMNIKCFPMLVYKEELVGYKDSDGKKHYYKDEWRKLNETQGIRT